MEYYKIKANEDFFKNVFNLLSDGGIYHYVGAGTTFVKSNGFLNGNKEALDSVKPIVSSDFFEKNFKLSPDEVPL